MSLCKSVHTGASVHVCVHMREAYALCSGQGAVFHLAHYITRGWNRVAPPSRLSHRARAVSRRRRKTLSDGPVMPSTQESLVRKGALPWRQNLYITGSLWGGSGTLNEASLRGAVVTTVCSAPEVVASESVLASLRVVVVAASIVAPAIAPDTSPGVRAVAGWRTHP